MQEMLDASGLLFVREFALLYALWRPDEHGAEDDGELLWRELVLLLAREYFSQEGDDVEERVVVYVGKFRDELLCHGCRLDFQYVSVEGEGDDGNFE